MVLKLINAIGIIWNMKKIFFVFCVICISLELAITPTNTHKNRVWMK